MYAMNNVWLSTQSLGMSHALLYGDVPQLVCMKMIAEYINVTHAQITLYVCC